MEKSNPITWFPLEGGSAIDGGDMFFVASTEVERSNPYS